MKLKNDVVARKWDWVVFEDGKKRRIHEYFELRLCGEHCGIVFRVGDQWYWYDPRIEDIEYGLYGERTPILVQRHTFRKLRHDEIMAHCWRVTYELHRWLVVDNISRIELTVAREPMIVKAR